MMNYVHNIQSVKTNHHNISYTKSAVTVFPEIWLKVLQFDLLSGLLYLIHQVDNSKCLFDMCLSSEIFQITLL